MAQPLGKSAYFALENVSKAYSDTTVLDNINLEIQENEFVCVLGNTGCGKSTLLKIMGGIDRADEGRIFFKGSPMENKNASQRQRHFGFVLQQDHLMGWRTVYQNIRFPLEVFGLKGSQYLSRIDDVLEIVGLKKYQHLYPKELSGGMRQRAAIARALVHDPAILFLDQPFDALDAITRRTLSYELLRMWNTTRKTIVMITNSVEEALLLSGRIFAMSDPPSAVIGTWSTGFSYEERMGNLQNNAVFQRLKREIRLILDQSQEVMKVG
jgi:NitT/TauT family transport system ATP-binding protein